MEALPSNFSVQTLRHSTLSLGQLLSLMLPAFFEGNLQTLQAPAMQGNTGHDDIEMDVEA